eukprot:Skav201169  [mRNA]  locus=scaffold65:559988:560548:- [translate_table: standard]
MLPMALFTMVAAYMPHTEENRNQTLAVLSTCTRARAFVGDLVWEFPLRLIGGNVGRYDHNGFAIASRVWAEGDATPAPRLGHLLPCGEAQAGGFGKKSRNCFFAILSDPFFHAWHFLWNYVPDIVVDIMFNDEVQVVWLRGGMFGLVDELGAVATLPGGIHFIFHIMVIAPVPAPPPPQVQVIEID